MDGPAIQVEGLRFSYDQVEVLHGLTFQLRPGEVLGLLGANGAGKSTTLKILAGILSCGSGKIRVQDFILPENRNEVKRLLGYVPESAGLYESLSAKEFLELCGRLHEIEEKRLQQKISRLLEVFDLGKERFHRLATFSKGMRQKVLISAALLHDPKILLLDEPLSGLDVVSSVLVKDLLAALARDGRTVFYSSHVLDVVERVCSRVLIIHKGNLIADGSPEQLKSSWSQPTLEDAFRSLTRASPTDPLVENILETMRL
jgi:ABC-2 type transport system ATP-binding protein